MSLLRWAAFISAIVVVATGCSSDTKHTARTDTRHPNIVFLLTDDLDVSAMAYMPNVERLLGDQGVSFSHYFISNSLCCPSRSSILRGQYAHNTGVESNGALNGGFETAYRLGIEQSTIGTWIQHGGYRTAYIGKYLNQYPDTAPATYVPPGWNEFDSAVSGYPYSEYRYTLNENHHLVYYGNKVPDYGTTVYLGKAEQFIEKSAGTPFFLYLNVYAPHTPATPAHRDRNLFPHARAPRTPSFNLADPGKPEWIRRLEPLGGQQVGGLDGLYRKRLQSLQAVDRGVAALVQTLEATGQMANTYFVFSSDNGFHLGQFHLPAGKETPYDTDIHVPLIVRGPGVPADRTSNFMVGNIDLAPTLAQLAGVKSPDFFDGRSFAGRLLDPASDPHPRQAYLLEHWRPSMVETEGSGPNEPRDLDAEAIEKSIPIAGFDFIPGYRGVRTVHYMYAEYSSTSRELYATDKDPYEIVNLASDPRYGRLVDELQALVNRLQTCRGATCRALEDAPIGS
jgi:N-acetylglucosamine-6-sulfatase